jgi:hypothetical protein
MTTAASSPDQQVMDAPRAFGVNLRRQPVIVLLGMMSTMPVGGVIWQTLHYLVGLRRLGFDVYYAEGHAIPPSMFTDATDFDGTDKAAAFIARTMARFDFGRRWSYRAWDDRQFFGVGETAIKAAFANATAVINLHGGTMPRPEHGWSGALIYLETDPVAPQVELHNKSSATREFLDLHTAHFTFGENLGAADCKVPLPPTAYEFHPTRQPVVLDFWEGRSGAPRDVFTTIANWRQSAREMTLEGEVYHWSKHHEFLKFLDLPRLTSQAFELALSSYEAPDERILEEAGWRVRRALDFSGDADAYRDYIASSRGEWTVAKDQNVRLRSGWFSDRAATYLAAGRPVVTQETGFSNVLPTGCGLFSFSDMDESVAAIEAIKADYERHARGALEIAREFFDAEKVLSALLQQAGVPLPNTR